MKVILIDNEELALDYLEHQLMSVSDFKIIGKFTNPFEGKMAIEQHEVDLVFLDIQMPDLNGMELAEQLLDKKPRLPIVFVTAYDHYAIKAFELNAIDYIVKPVSTARLLTTIKRVEQKVKDNYSHSLNNIERLRLNLFGHVNLSEYSNGKRKDIPLKWRTTKVKHLFLYLLRYHGQEINKTFLVDLLWPDLELGRAYQQLYTATYNIRQTLGQYNDYFKLKSTVEGYVLELRDIDIDVEQFETFIQSSLPLNKTTIADYEKAITIFTGDYLQQYDYTWIESDRQRWQLYWVSTALKVVDWYYEQNELKKALFLSLDICRRYPLEEEAHFFIMKIYNKIGNLSAVYQQYVKLKEILFTDLQVEPRLDITKWYHNWNEENKMAAIKK